MNSTSHSHQQEPSRIRAIVFTSVIAGGFLTLLALVTLYGPVAAQQREEEVLIDLSMSMPPLTESDGSTALGSEKNPLPQKQVAAPHNLKSQSHENLPPDNTDALFPGMKSTEDGDGSDKTNTPGSDKTFGHTEPGPYDNAGHNPDYQLGGRNCIFKPTIQTAIEDEGKVMINIWVDEKGNVTRASINEQNTNTNSQAVRKLALNAALKTKWSEKKGSPEQKGHIAYQFLLK